MVSFCIALPLLASGEHPASISFKTLRLPKSPNTYLVCPPDACATRPMLSSPIYTFSADELRRRWQEMIKKQSKVTLLHSDLENMQFQYVQRVGFFNFPDYIDVKFISIDNKKSTLAIYSRSKYGYYDFGVNKRRIIGWLNEL